MYCTSEIKLVRVVGSREAPNKTSVLSFNSGLFVFGGNDVELCVLSVVERQDTAFADTATRLSSLAQIRCLACAKKGGIGMNDFLLLGNWDQSVDPELYALKKGFSILLDSATVTLQGVPREQLQYVSALCGQLVDDLEAKLVRLDKHIQKTNVA